MKSRSGASSNQIWSSGCLDSLISRSETSSNVSLRLLYKFGIRDLGYLH